VAEIVYDKMDQIMSMLLDREAVIAVYNGAGTGFVSLTTGG
jgi:hypothetical protein